MTNDTQPSETPDVTAPNTVATVTAAIERKPAIVLDDEEVAIYRSLQTGAVFFQLDARHISTFTGEKAADALNGLVSNDLLPLPVGRGVYAAALTPKGKMLADVSILRTEVQTFVVETSDHAGREWWSMVRKYVNPRLAKYRDDSAALATIGVYGASAPALMARLGVGGMGDATVTEVMEEGLRAWGDWTNASFTLSGISVRLIRAPHLGNMPGYIILVPVADRADLIKNLRRVGAVAGNDAVWQIAALEGARPALGYDMDANTIPQEANLDEWSAISYEKGCYTGQETVARVHFRGHVNKHLRSLASSTLLAPGDAIFDATGKSVGEVRRSGLSPRFGPIAIGMIRREVPVDSEVAIGSANSDVKGRVVAASFQALPELDANEKKRGAP